jgi:hypothetical protein
MQNAKMMNEIVTRVVQPENVKRCKSDAGMNECASPGLFKLT